MPKSAKLLLGFFVLWAAAYATAGNGVAADLWVSAVGTTGARVLADGGPR